MIFAGRLGAISTADVTSLITGTATAKGVDPSLALAVARHESGLNPAAQNPTSSAAGLFQLVKSAQQTYGVTNPYDPTQNTVAGVSFLSDMLRKYNGNQDLALMAYAWGPGNVDKWISAGSNPAAVPAEASQFISWVDGQTGISSPSFGDGSLPVDDGIESASLVDTGSGPVFLVAAGVGLLAFVFWHR